jgi:hypothetical protein
MRFRAKLGHQRFIGLAGVGIEHGDGVAIGIGDEEAAAGLGQQHLMG